MEPSATNIIIRIVFAVIGVLVGISIFFSFAFAWSNWNCAAWGLTSALFAFITLLVHIEFRRDRWDRRSPWLRPLMLSGCWVQLLGVVAFTVYMTLAIAERQSVTPSGRGFYVAAVWCFMTWKWGFWLFWCSRQYRRLYSQRHEHSPDTGYEKM